MADAEIRAVARRHIRLSQKYAGAGLIAAMEHRCAAEMKTNSSPAIRASTRKSARFARFDTLPKRMLYLIQYLRKVLAFTTR
jgi:hypothetical protein